MLTYQDRQKFERIRAQWETAQPLSDDTPRMVGRKEKQVAPLPFTSNTNDDGPGSRFRRKLSYGLSFISNPLSQRKTTPGRPQPAQAGSASRSTAPLHPHETDRLLPSDNESSPFDQVPESPLQRTPSHEQPTTDQTVDPDATPRPLPRSRTMSYIPRPNRNGNESSASMASTSNPHRPALALDTRVRSPTKIPTPSPPQDGARHASPRQYLHQYTTQQEKHIAAGAAFAATSAQSPSRSSARSYTPNLVKGVRQPQPHFMRPRKAMQKKSTSSPVVQPVLKENTPTGTRETRRTSQIQDGTGSRRESLVPQTRVSNRLSFGPGPAPVQSKQAVRTTPSTSSKRLSARSPTQTPQTAKRVSINYQKHVQAPNASRHTHTTTIAQPRLLGPVNPPTPALADTTGTRPALPRASTVKDLRRRSLGLSTSLSGVGASSRSLATVNTEVRLPRSSTFHHVRRFREEPPPIPPIPERYRISSQRPAAYYGGYQPDIRGPCSPLARFSPLQSTMPAFKEPQQEETSDTRVSSPFINDPEDDQDAKFYAEAALFQPSMLPTAQSNFLKCPRSISVNAGGVPYADADNALQVTDHMPAIWWAGRFQARFDQWRNEAMKAELDPKYKPEGLLGQCKLNQDKIAACYVLLQLRALCASDKAAESLSEFEYKYRQDHRLLATMVDLPLLSSHKRYEATSPRQGPLGRAVRKLTPRKSSLVNLLKGKGWNRSDEAKSHHGSSEHDTFSGACQERTSNSS